MLAKVISHSPNRTEAALTLANALENLHLAGVTTNRDFLTSVLRHERFLEGKTTTDFIEDNSPEPKLQLTEDEIESVAITATLWLQGKNRKNSIVLSSIPSGLRNGRLPAQEVSLLYDEEKLSVSYKSRRDASFLMTKIVKLHKWSARGIELR